MSMEMPASQRFKTWFWEIGAVAFIALALGGSGNDGEKTPIDCVEVLPPAEQTVGHQAPADFLIRLAQKDTKPMELSFRKVPDGYYVDFGHPGENLLIASNDLENSEGHVVALLTSPTMSMVAHLKKSEGEPAIVTASCVENHVPKPGNYAAGTIVS